VATLSWDSPDGRREFQLGAVARLGRAPSNDVCLSSPGVSGHHARILRRGATWAIEDIGSKNGTYINDVQKAHHELQDGDVIGIGDVDLVFHGDALKRMGGRDDQPETKTLMWRADADDVPVPEAAPQSEADPSPEAPTRHATSLDSLFQGNVDYSRVSSVDSSVLMTGMIPRAGQDPAELGRRLRASYEIAQATAETLDPSEILDRVLGALFEIFEAADRGFILLVDPETGEMSTAASRQRTAAVGEDAGVSMTALEEAMRTRQALLCRDAAADERFSQAQSILGLGIRSMMIAPLVSREQVLGAVHVDSIRGIREFRQADLELLSVAACQVANCLANARLHEQVVASERLAAIGQTLAGLTHCIKNILQGIRGGAFILDKGLDKGNLDRVRSGWEMVRRNNAFMEELVYDLLTYSKERKPELAPTDVNAQCGEICELARERAKRNDVALVFEPDPALTTAEIDSKGVRRCLLNLVMNAIDACGEDGRVTVSTAAAGDDDLFRIAIRDNGCGMSKETLAKLFTAFFSTKGSKGTGLGLPVTQKIIEEHGGRIDVESTEGEGTTFTLCLPPHRTHTEGE